MEAHCEVRREQDTKANRGFPSRVKDNTIALGLFNLKGSVEKETGGEVSEASSVSEKRDCNLTPRTHVKKPDETGLVEHI